MSYSRSILLLPSVVAELLVFRASAQSGVGSPYSSYGFGDLVNAAQASQAMMGGVSIAVEDPFRVLPLNPASYVRLVRPVFDTGTRLTYSDLRTSDVRGGGRDGRFMGFNIGVPFSRGKWGAALGLQPITEVGYHIEDQASLPDGGDVRLDYSGYGGLNRAYAGLGYLLWQRRDTLNGQGSRLALGANFNYLFGNVQQVRKTVYPTGQGYANTYAFNALVLGIPTINAGVQFSDRFVSKEVVAAHLARRKERRRIRFEERNGSLPDSLRKTDMKRMREAEAWRFTLGATAEFQIPTAKSATHEQLVSTYIISSGIEFTLDTVEYTEGERGQVTLPTSYGIGFSVHDSRWTLAADVRMRNWRDLRVNVGDYAVHGDLSTNMNYALGVSWLPRGDRLGGSFFGRSIWRMGLRYSDDYLVVKGAQLSEIGMSFGTSLPLLNSTTRSRIDLGAEFGRRGSTSAGSIDQRFTNIYIGLTFTPDLRESWLRKRRIE